MSNTFKTAMLLGVLSALLLLIGQLLGGTQGLVIGFLFAVVTNFASTLKCPIGVVAGGWCGSLARGVAAPSLPPEIIVAKTGVSSS